MKDYASPFLCLRMNSSRSMGMARSRSFSHDIVLNLDLVRCLAAEYFFLFTRYFNRRLWISGLFLCAQLQSFCRVLLCCRTQWVRRCGSDEGSQSFLLTFAPHQYLLMSSSFGVPDRKSSMSKLIMHNGWTQYRQLQRILLQKTEFKQKRIKKSNRLNFLCGIRWSLCPGNT